MHAEPSHVSVPLLKVFAGGWFPLLCIALWAFAPYADESWIICPFRRTTGIPCPSCGMTRAIGWLLRGEVSRSLHYHPLGGVVFGGLAGGWIYGIGVVFRGWRLLSRQGLFVGLILTGILVGGVWIFRLVGWASRGGIPPELR